MKTLIGVLILLVSVQLFAQSKSRDRLSYSGRLVDLNGLPVSGTPTLLFTLSVDTTANGTADTQVCQQRVSAVTLNNGVFAVELGFPDTDGANPDECSYGGNATLTTVLEYVQRPDKNYPVYVVVQDETNTKTYDQQLLTAVPYALHAMTLGQMGAAAGQILKWDDTNKAWIPGALDLVTNGNVGVGTGMTLAPSVPLEVSNAVADPTLQLTTNPLGAEAAAGTVATTGGNLVLKPSTGAASIGIPGTVGAANSLSVIDAGGVTTAKLNSTGASYLTGGNLGLGTTTPSQMLHIYQNTGTVAAKFENEGLGTFTMGIDSADSNKFKIAENTDLTANARITIEKTSGNVGINNTTPVATLDVTGFMKLTKNAAQPVACAAGYDGAIALTSINTLCICDGTDWVLIQGGVCDWN